MRVERPADGFALLSALSRSARVAPVSRAYCSMLSMRSTSTSASENVMLTLSMLLSTSRWSAEQCRATRTEAFSSRKIGISGSEVPRFSRDARATCAASAATRWRSSLPPSDHYFPLIEIVRAGVHLADLQLPGKQPELLDRARSEQPAAPRQIRDSGEVGHVRLQRENSKTQVNASEERKMNAFCQLANERCAAGAVKGYDESWIPSRQVSPGK